MMNRLLQFCFLFSLLIFNTLFSEAQDFPATKKQVVDWLTASEALVVNGRKLNAEDINMKATIRFSNDSSYSMMFMCEERKGIFEINMEEKLIKIIK